MPILDWIGKKKVLNHHSEVPFRVLEKQYTYKDGEIDNSFDSENKIIHGDNLEALKSLLPEYEGKIKCIYIDPPYNTGEEHWIYNDNMNDPRIEAWLGETVGNEGEDLTRHDKWHCMMYPRLKLLHRLLGNDGAIFISIDDNELYSFKLMCDEIFGRTNFVGNIIIKSNPRGSMSEAKIAKQHEYLLIYAKNIQEVDIKGQDLSEKMKNEYNLSDENGNFRLLGLRMRGGFWRRTERPNLYFPIYINPLTNKVSLIKNDVYSEVAYPIQPSTNEDGTWRWSKEKVSSNCDKLIGKQVQRGENLVWDIYQKDYYDKDKESERKTKTKSLWDGKEFNYQNGTTDIKNIFGYSKAFEYSKPKELIEKCINIMGTTRGSIILDSFAGSGTTAHAVLSRNKADGGNRKFILVELCDYAEEITAERVKRVIKGYKAESEKEDLLYDKELTVKNLAHVSEYLDEAKDVSESNKDSFDSVKTKLDNNHLQVIGKIKASEDIVGTGGDFTFYELGKPLFKDNFLNEEVDISHIRSYIWFTETHTSLSSIVTDDNEYYLGTNNNVGYWFFYEKDKETCLNTAFLNTIKTKSEQYIIYADKCCLSEDLMREYNIVFKKIPREIQRF